ncbi:GlxA family transcriptional regulator [Aquibaculum sediminis]|uniref:GlxA family transcriptional regulator n=1 Tax=Aquibaculum sediminis TaxID=3231907 RepID=UPI0034530871
MLTERNRETPQRVGFLLVPGFSMLCLVSAIEPLRVANQRGGGHLYSWHFFSADGEPVQASNGMAIVAEAPIAEVGPLPVVITVAGFDVDGHADPRIAAWLRHESVRGADLGALDTGPFLLARAGLLGGYRVTLHWEALPAFREAFPDIDARETLFEIDRNRFTCSGGTAALDLMLHLISLGHGAELAHRVSEQFIHDQIRAPEEQQRMPADRRVGARSERLADVLETMEDNMEEPLSLDDLASQAGLSKRQLSRLFRNHVGAPPLRHYLNLRLDRAQQLLQQTRMPVFEVGLACGFSSAPYFSRAYHARFGHPPVQERRDDRPRQTPFGPA